MFRKCLNRDSEINPDFLLSEPQIIMMGMTDCDEKIMVIRNICGSDSKALKGRIGTARGEALGNRDKNIVSPEGAYYLIVFQIYNFLIRPFRAYNYT